MSLIQILLAIFLPPIAVFLRYGLSGKFWINLLLTILGVLPGSIHAFYVLTRPE